MKRSTLITLLRTAGYHNDMQAWSRLYAEHRIALDVATRTFAEGRKLREGGVRCICNECRRRP